MLAYRDGLRPGKVGIGPAPRLDVVIDLTTYRETLQAWVLLTYETTSGLLRREPARD
jgi:hypothetical protein